MILPLNHDIYTRAQEARWKRGQHGGCKCPFQKPDYKKQSKRRCERCLRKITISEVSKYPILVSVKIELR